jgi:hypothetical protein
MRGPICAVLMGVAILMSPPVSATVYDEAVDGDLSGNRLAPTTIPLTVGSNRITATSSAGDIEYYHLTVPAGFRLSALNVISSTSASLSFIAVQRGSTFTEPPTGTVVANLLGYAHFGPANGTIGTDILDDLGRGAGAIDFVPPLASGDLTFWSQETSTTPSTYQLEFVVTAVPPVPVSRSAITAIGVGLALIGARQLRRTGSARRCAGMRPAGC